MYDLLGMLKDHCHLKSVEKDRLEKLDRNKNMSNGMLRFFMISKRILKSHVKERYIKR
jgi:hypothetical protein